MRFIFLLVLIVSCGKHQMPTYENLTDSDGDQILDRDEYKQRYVGNVAKTDSPEGSLKLNIEPFDKKNKVFRFHPFNIKDVTYDLITKDKLKNEYLPYLFENSFIKAEPDQTIQEKIPENFSAIFTIKPQQLKISQLYLHTSHKTLTFIPVNEVIHLSLTREILNELLAGYAYFSFRQSDQLKLIKDMERKSYRFFISDGNKSEIKYFSRELDPMKILEMNNIEVFKNLDEENLFTTKIEQDYEGWWIKKINHNDFIIVYDSLRNLSSHFFKKAKSLKLNLKRVNGAASFPLQLRNEKSGKILLVLREKRFVQIYSNGSKTSTIFPILTPGKKMCEKNDYKNRRPVAEKVNQFFIEKNFSLFVSPKSLQEKIIWKELFDDKGTYWEIEIPSEVLNLYLQLEHLPQSNNLDPLSDPFYCIFENRFSKREVSFELSIDAFLENI